MKHIKKLVSFMLAMFMVLSLGITAFAADSTGSIKINSNTNVSVAGKTFNAYKILDVKSYTDSSVVYTVPAELKTFYKNRYGLTGEEGDFDAQVVAKIAAETDRFVFAADALAAAKSAVGIVKATGTAGDSDDSVTINDLPLGYYVVEDSGAGKPISALILDTTNPNVELEIKADQPGIDKKIDGSMDKDPSTEGLVENNNAAVGDKVPYVVTSKVPDMTGYKKYYFIVNDTLQKGLKFNNDVVITIGGTSLAANTDYTVEVTENDNGTTSVEIVFKNFINYKDPAFTNSEIKITYSATVNKEAVIGVAGNPNSVTLTYSNNPNIQDNGTPDNSDKPADNTIVSETPPEETRTYVTALDLIKVDPQQNRLTGAEFTITGERTNIVLVSKDVFTKNSDGEYWKLKNGTYTTTAPTDDNTSAYESTTDKYSKETVTEPKNTQESVTATGEVGSDGILRFEGLSAGQYEIEEIKSPAGYNLLKDPINITISWAAPDAPSTDCTWTVTGYDGATIDNGVVVITIQNQSGTELPATGGMGTTIFYVVGSVLVLAAVVLLVTKKRMSARD